MKSRLLSNISGRREWALIFDEGDETMVELSRFAANEQLTAAHFSGIGAFSRVTVAWFDLDKKKYRPIKIGEQVEVISLIGDIAEADGQPSVHAHLCVGKSDGTAHGGHLQEGWVRPTIEIVLIESPAHLRKTYRPAFGIALIDLDR